MEEARHHSSVSEIRCVGANADGREIETPRQLAELLGGEEFLVWNHHEGHMDWCLCAIDVPKSLHGSGMTCSHQSGQLLIERTTESHV